MRLRNFQREPWLIDLAAAVSADRGVPASALLSYSKSPDIVAARRELMVRASNQGRTRAAISTAMDMAYKTVDDALATGRPVFRTVRA